MIIVENLIDDARENAFWPLMSLNMLIEFGDAFDFTGADFAGWCKEVGFKEIVVVPLAGLTSAGIAYKERRSPSRPSSSRSELQLSPRRPPGAQFGPRHRARSALSRGSNTSWRDVACSRGRSDSRRALAERPLR